jgi:hypothetical protein
MLSNQMTCDMKGGGKTEKMSILMGVMKQAVSSLRLFSITALMMKRLERNKNVFQPMEKENGRWEKLHRKA